MRSFVFSLAACALAAGCTSSSSPAPPRPTDPNAAAKPNGAAEGPAPVRNEEFKFAVRWPEPPKTTSPAGAKEYKAEVSPGGKVSPLVYFVHAFAPPPPAKPGDPPPTSLDDFLYQQTKGAGKTVAEKKSIKLKSGQPALEVVTRSATAAGPAARTERAVYALHGGRGYVAGVYSGLADFVESAPADRFLASLELFD
jgi:hypothetical protein